MSITEGFEGLKYTEAFPPKTHHAYPAEAVNQLLVYTRELEAQRRWVEIGDSSPENGTTVLVWCGHVDVGRFNDKNGFMYETSGGVYRIKNVTHWQPLPGAPT
jgi:hypothetical protein